MKSLKECTTLAEAQPFLRNATPTQRKVVETAFALMKHPSEAQQAIGQQFWQTAIQEMDKSEEPTPHHDNGIKSKGDHFVKEETLSGGNKSGTDGSEQSSDNTPPYPGEGEQSENGQKDMEKAEGTENQFSESMMPGMMPGLDPQLAQQMAPQGQMPPMTTPQQIQQMQYTVKEMMRPIIAHIKKQETQIGYQNKAIKHLTTQLQETQQLKGGLDLNGYKERQVVPIQETTMPRSVSNIDQQAPRIFEKSHQLEEKRSKISEMNRMLDSSPYK
jgi:hypothetical protein